MTTVDVPEPEFVVNQATFYLTLLITLGSAAAIIANTVRSINNKIKQNRLDAEAKVKVADDLIRKYVDDKMDKIEDMKRRVDHIYFHLIDEWFDERDKSGTGHGKSK